MDSDEDEVERRATDAVRENGRAVADAYRRKFGSEIAPITRGRSFPRNMRHREKTARDSAMPPRSLRVCWRSTCSRMLFAIPTRKTACRRVSSRGTGAGKTTGLAASRELSDAQLVYDSNLGSKKSSVQKIDAAKAAGNRVRVYFVSPYILCGTYPAVSRRSKPASLGNMIHAAR